MHTASFPSVFKTFSSLLSFWRRVYTDQGKLFSMYWISSNFCSKLLVFASVFAWKHKWKRSKTLPCARSLSIYVCVLLYAEMWFFVITCVLHFRSIKAWFPNGRKRVVTVVEIGLQSTLCDSYDTFTTRLTITITFTTRFTPPHQTAFSSQVVAWGYNKDYAKGYVLLTYGSD